MSSAVGGVHLAVDASGSGALAQLSPRARWRRCRPGRRAAGCSCSKRGRRLVAGGGLSRGARNAAMPDRRTAQPLMASRKSSRTRPPDAQRPEARTGCAGRPGRRRRPAPAATRLPRRPATKLPSMPHAGISTSPPSTAPVMVPTVFHRYTPPSCRPTSATFAVATRAAAGKAAPMKKVGTSSTTQQKREGEHLVVAARCPACGSSRAAPCGTGTAAGRRAAARRTR